MIIILTKYEKNAFKGYRDGEVFFLFISFIKMLNSRYLNSFLGLRGTLHKFRSQNEFFPLSLIRFMPHLKQWYNKNLSFYYIFKKFFLINYYR
jgi:hypothetical protein